MGGFKVPEVEENVGCNLIPMIDIMFLLLLFFMLGADMSQREIADVVLPKADQVKEEDKKRDKFGRTTINIQMKDTSIEPKDRPVEYRLDENNWEVAIRGNPFDWLRLKDELTQLAENPDDLEPDVDPYAKKRLSGRLVHIRADQYAPYGLIQKTMEVAGQAGLYKIEVAAARPDAAAK